MNTPRVVIVGGGIAGLAAARRLREQLPTSRITLLERAGKVGGKLRTEQIGGFLIEAGPDSFLGAKPEVRALAHALGISDRIEGTRPASPRAYVMRGGRLRAIPEGLSGLVPSRLGPLLSSSLLSWRGKARLALDVALPRGRTAGDEPAERFITRRLGGEAWSWLVQPLLAGIYGGDGGALSSESVLPELRRRELRHGSVLRRGRGPVGGTPGFFTFRGGMQELVDTLAAQLHDVELCTGADVTAVEKDGEGFRVHLADGSSMPAGAVIVATPAHAAARQCAAVDPELSSLLGRIPFASCATVSLAFREVALDTLPNGHGYLRASAERGAALAVTWVSRKFNGRAPEGGALVRVFLDGRAAASEDEGVLILAARAELQTVGITAEPLFARVQRWPLGMPQYAPGHRSLAASIQQAVRRVPGFALAGHSYDGVGISDAIRSAHSAADSIATQLCHEVAIR